MCIVANFFFNEHRSFFPTKPGCFRYSHYGFNNDDFMQIILMSRFFFVVPLKVNSFWGSFPLKWKKSLQVSGHDISFQSVLWKGKYGVLEIKWKRKNCNKCFLTRGKPITKICSLRVPANHQTPMNI